MGEKVGWKLSIIKLQSLMLFSIFFPSPLLLKLGINAVGEKALEEI